MILSMSESDLTEEPTRLNYYEPLFTDHVLGGNSSTDAAIRVAEAYLDGKPRKRGKHKLTRAERDAAFWFTQALFRNRFVAMKGLLHYQSKLASTDNHHFDECHCHSWGWFLGGFRRIMAG